MKRQIRDANTTGLEGYLTYDVEAIIRDYWPTVEKLKRLASEYESLDGALGLPINTKVKSSRKAVGLEDIVNMRVELRRRMEPMQGYLTRFESALDSLDESHRAVIEAYRDEPRPIEAIQQELHCSRSEAYRLKARAFEQFGRML